MSRYREKDGLSEMFARIPLCTDDDNDFIHIDDTNRLFLNNYSVFNEFRTNCQLCDIVLVMEGKKLSAHKIVLAASIPYFRGMFTLDMMEANMKEITIEDLEFTTMVQLIDYVYTGKLRISTSNVQSLMMGANFLQLLEVVDQSAEFLVSRLHSTNCLSIREFCRRMCCKPELLKSIDDYVKKHFLAVSKDEEFKRLEAQDFLEIINFNGLYVDSEEDVFNCALAWLKTDEKRQKYAARALSCIRLPLLVPSFLSSIVATHQVFKNNIECRDLIDEAKDYHLLPERRSSIKSFKLEPRVCTDIPGLLVAIGGLLVPAESRSSVEIYNPILRKWNPVKEMETLRTRVGVAVFNRQIYAIGGFNGHDRLTLVEYFDYDTNTWNTVAPLNRKRSALAATFVSRKLYVCGGYDGIESLSSVEVYDIDKKQWEHGKDMLKQRSAAGIAMIDGYVYVCGGHDGMQIFSSVERYDVNNDKWEMVCPMINKRCRFGATAYNGKIYVAGGYDGSSFLRSVEVFDPTTMKWSDVTPMNMRRSRVSLVANLDGLYAVAGYDGENNLCSVEIYDEKTETWTLGTPLTAHEGGVAVGAIRVPPKML